MNYAAAAGYLGWAAHHRDTTAVMCRVNTTGNTHTCWEHDGDTTTHDGDTVLPGDTAAACDRSRRT